MFGHKLKAKELTGQELNTNLQSMQIESESSTLIDHSEGADRQLSISTHKHSNFDGKIYILRCSSVSEAQKWTETCRRLHELAIRKHNRQFSQQRIQRRIESFYAHSSFQTLFAWLILGNFMASMLELQFRDPSLVSTFKVVDVVFTVIFLVELLMVRAKKRYSTIVACSTI